MYIPHSIACLIGDFSGLCICLYRSLWTEPLYSWLFLCASCPYVLLYHVFLSVYVSLCYYLCQSLCTYVLCIYLCVYLPSSYLSCFLFIYYFPSLYLSSYQSICTTYPLSLCFPSSLCDFVLHTVFLYICLFSYMTQWGLILSFAAYLLLSVSECLCASLNNFLSNS